MSSQKTELNTSRKNYLPAGCLNMTCLGEILNFRSESAFVLGKVSTSGCRIEIYLTEAQNFLVCWLSSRLVQTIILLPEDEIPSACEKFSTSCQRMQFFARKFQLPARGIIMGLDWLTTSGLRMVCSFDSSNFGLENWNLPSSSLKHSSQRTELKVGRNYHLPAGTFSIPGWERFTTSGRRMKFFLGEFQLSGRMIGIYITKLRSYLLERLSSKLVESIIFQLEDSMLPAWGKFSTSDLRMQFLLGRFQLSEWRIEIYQAESKSFLVGRQNSIVVKTHISLLEG